MVAWGSTWAPSPANNRKSPPRSTKASGPSRGFAGGGGEGILLWSELLEKPAAGCWRREAVPDPGQPFWRHRGFSKTQHHACGPPRQRQELPWLCRGSRGACSGAFLAEPCSAWSLEYAASYFKGARALGRPRSAPVPAGKEQRPGGVEPTRRSRPAALSDFC